MRTWTKIFWQHYFMLCMPLSLMLWTLHFAAPMLTPDLYTMPLWAPIVSFIIALIITDKK